MNKQASFNLSFIADTPMKEELERQETSDHFFDEILHTLSFENAIVLPSLNYNEDGMLPGGILTCSGEYLEESGYHEGNCCKYNFNKDLVETDESTVVYVGFFLNCYGHGFTDNIKKIWYLSTPEFEAIKKDVSIIYITERNEPMPNWQKEIFSLAGIDTSTWIHVSRITKYKKIIIPQNSIRSEKTKLSRFRSFSLYYRNTIDRIIQSVSNEGAIFEKIYFTRTANNIWWRECGEERIEKMFRKYGYQIISPESLSVKEQIRLLKNCSFFASTEGSCAHNSIFCKPYTNVTIIRKADYCNSYQCMIDVFANLKVTYIDAHHSIRNNKQLPMSGPFYLYASKELHNYFGESFYYPYWCDILFWVYAKDKWYWYHKLKNILKRAKLIHNETAK